VIDRILIDDLLTIPAYYGQKFPSGDCLTGVKLKHDLGQFSYRDPCTGVELLDEVARALLRKGCDLQLYP
jgi:hypothetical protein